MIRPFTLDVSETLFVLAGFAAIGFMIGFAKSIAWAIIVAALILYEPKNVLSETAARLLAGLLLASTAAFLVSVSL